MRHRPNLGVNCAGLKLWAGPKAKSKGFALFRKCYHQIFGDGCGIDMPRSQAPGWSKHGEMVPLCCLRAVLFLMFLVALRLTAHVSGVTPFGKMGGTDICTKARGESLKANDQ